MQYVKENGGKYQAFLLWDTSQVFAAVGESIGFAEPISIVVGIKKAAVVVLNFIAAINSAFAAPPDSSVCSIDKGILRVCVRASKEK